MTRNISRPGSITALLACAALLVGCGGIEQSDGQTGGTLIVVVPAEPTTLFPPTEATTQGIAVLAQLFDRLAEIGPALNTVGDQGFSPRLASSWEWAPDSLSIAFTIDSAAHWHDGAPVVAEDVRYTFRTYTSEDVGSQSRLLLSNIDSVSVPNSHTAVFWFKRRTPQQFFDASYHMFILPSHLLSSTADSALVTSSFAQQPVGTGRFRFVRWVRGELIEVIADTANWRGRAQLDRVVFSRTDGAGAATVQLFSGDADMFEQMRPENFEQVARSTDIRLIAQPSLSYQFLGFNMRNPRAENQPHPVLGELAVRRALVLATDRDRLVRSLFDTLGAASIGPAPRALMPDTNAFRRTATDVAAARALLDSAGWVDADGDGIREKNGVRLSFEVMAPNTSLPRQRAATQLQEQYRAVGVELRPVTLTRDVMLPRMESGSFDAYMGGWQATPGLRGVPGAWASKGPQNFQKYSNSAFDAALDTALSSFDAATAAAALAHAFQITWDDPPSVWLFEPQNPIALHKRIQPTSIRADGWYYGLADWYVEPSQRIDRDRIGLRTEASR